MSTLIKIQQSITQAIKIIFGLFALIEVTKQYENIGSKNNNFAKFKDYCATNDLIIVQLINIIRIVSMLLMSIFETNLA